MENVRRATQLCSWPGGLVRGNALVVLVVSAAAVLCGGSGQDYERDAGGLQD